MMPASTNGNPRLKRSGDLPHRGGRTALHSTNTGLCIGARIGAEGAAPTQRRGREAQWRGRNRHAQPVRHHHAQLPAPALAARSALACERHQRSKHARSAINQGRPTPAPFLHGTIATVVSSVLTPRSDFTQQSARQAMMVRTTSLVSLGPRTGDGNDTRFNGRIVIASHE